MSRRVRIAAGPASPRAWLSALLCLLCLSCLPWLPSPVAAQGSLRDALPAAAGTEKPGAQATLGARRVDAVEAELVADRAAIVPGEPFRLGLRLKHAPHWHTYWRNPGDSGLPTQFQVRLPAGFEAGAIRWPAPVRIAVGPLANYGYEGEIVLPVTVEAPGDAAVGRTLRIEAAAEWLVCKDVCVPGEARLAIEMPVIAQAAAPSGWLPLFEAMDARTPPDETRPARAWRDGDALALVFEGQPRRAELFPHAENVIQPAAPQRLSHLEDGARLDVPLARGATLEEIGKGALLMLDGRPVTLSVALQAGAPPAAGRPVSEAVALAAEPSTSTATAVPAGALGLALVSGVLGGLLLNLMPCVFPVIGLKLMGFVRDAGGDPRGARRQAWCFAAGVLSAFWLLALVLIGLQAAGEAAGWGFQLQSPPFVAAMALLFTLVGLNLAGVYEVGVGLTRLAGAEGRMVRPGTPLGAFGAGVLATLVATPCTAPFMGSAIGFTLGQPATVMLAVLTAVGLGMAAPYVALAHSPRLLARLPRPGRWMESFRQFLSFPMFATVAWLLWVLGLQAGADAVLRLGMAAVLVAFAAWLHGRFVQRDASPKAALAALLALMAAGWVVWPVGVMDDASKAVPVPAATTPAGAAAPGAEWEPYSEARLQTLRAEGRTVFVDFTAAWCISCQANKKLVLETDAARSLFARERVALLRADWTRRDPEITRALAAHGRNGVPLYLVWRPGAPQARVLPEILGMDTLIRAISG